MAFSQSQNPVTARHDSPEGGKKFRLGTFFFNLPRRQDRGSGVALAPSGRSFLEHELGAVGHGGPDAGELVASRFRMEPRPLDGLLQLVAE